MPALPANPANLARSTTYAYGVLWAAGELLRRKCETERIHRRCDFIERRCLRARENKQNAVTLLDYRNLYLVGYNIVYRKVQPGLPEGSAREFESLGRVGHRTHFAAPYQEGAGRFQVLCSSFKLGC